MFTSYLSARVIFFHFLIHFLIFYCSYYLIVPFFSFLLSHMRLRRHQCPHMSLWGGNVTIRVVMVPSCVFVFQPLEVETSCLFLCERHLRRAVKQKWHKTCRSFPHCSSSSFALTVFVRDVTGRGSKPLHFHKCRMKMNDANCVDINLSKTFTQVNLFCTSDMRENWTRELDLALAADGLSLPQTQKFSCSCHRVFN